MKKPDIFSIIAILLGTATGIWIGTTVWAIAKIAITFIPH